VNSYPPEDSNSPETPRKLGDVIAGQDEPGASCHSLLHDLTAGGKIEAAERLGQMASNPNVGLALSIPLRFATDVRLRQACAKALKNHLQPDTVKVVLLAIETDRSERVRQEALDTIMQAFKGNARKWLDPQALIEGLNGVLRRSKISADFARAIRKAIRAIQKTQKAMD
jgi:hypothetical protein